MSTVAVTTMDGAPFAVDGVKVEKIVESWRVVDRWWTEAPVVRQFVDLRLVDGRALVLRHEDGAWSEV